jgi:hypothetical protein
MARDTRKKLYVDVGFLQGSELLARFLKDAEMSHHAEHLGLHILTRLADYYRMIDNPVQVVTTTTVDLERKPMAQPQSIEKARAQFEAVEEASEAEQMANADGAADFFGVL